MLKSMQRLVERESYGVSPNGVRPIRNLEPCGRLDLARREQAPWTTGKKHSWKVWRSSRGVIIGAGKSLKIGQ